MNIEMFKRRQKFWNLFLLMSALFVFYTWYKSLYVVGADTDQGNVYRIMYVHVPAAFNSFIWVVWGGLAGFWALAKKSSAEASDLSSQAAMELGALFSLLTLVTGSVWGKPTWGVWWDWDPRLTSMLVMFIMCCGYLLMRSFTPEPRSRRNVSSIIAILTCINVPIVYFSVNIWRSLHQEQTFTTQGSTASLQISIMFWMSVAALILFALGIYKIRRQALSVEKALMEARESL